MKNKLTNNMLKQMIREVLSEGKLLIKNNFKDLSNGPHSASSNRDRKDLGIQVGSMDFMKMKKHIPRVFPESKIRKTPYIKVWKVKEKFQSILVMWSLGMQG